MNPSQVMAPPKNGRYFLGSRFIRINLPPPRVFNDSIEFKNVSKSFVNTECHDPNYKRKQTVLNFWISLSNLHEKSWLE